MFVDTNDRKVKQKDDIGVVNGLVEDGLRGNNLIINGEFDYAQRQTAGTLATYSNTTGRSYSADRFGITNENTSVQYQRLDTSGVPEAGLHARYSGAFSKITTTGKFFVSQVIEAGNCLHLRGRTVRVQMLMRASSAKTIRFWLLQLTNAGTVDTIPATFISAVGANTVDPTFGTNLSKIAPVLVDNCTIRTVGLDCSVTTAWQRFSATFLLPTDFKNLVLVIGTDSQFVAADVLRMSEVGIYDGAEIREWAPRVQADQLVQCQRYYCKSFAIDTIPAQNAGLTGAIRGAAGQAGAISFAHLSIRFPVAMRAAPTIVYFNPSVANAFLRATAQATDATATSATQVTADQTEVTATGLAAWVKGDGLAIHFTADAEL